MSILQVGRVFDGIDVDVSSISWSGDQLSISGELALGAVTAADRPGVAMACRDRINALIANDDDPVVAVSWTEDSSVDGYYRATGAQVADTMASLIEGHLAWQIDLYRTGGGSLPQFEVYGLHSVRTNPHSITNASLNGASVDPMVGLPAAAVDIWSGSISAAQTTRTASSGAVLCQSEPVSFPLSMTTTFTALPSVAYVGACEIRTTYGTATSQLVTGMVAPSAFSGLILSNGLVRCFVHPSINYGFEVEVYDGSQWEDLAGGVAWTVRTQIAAPATTWQLDYAQIIRNTPEACTIRLISTQALGRGYGRYWLDLTVKRGSRVIWGYGQTDYAAGRFDIRPSSSVAATALTGGVRATSADASGNRAVWGAAGAAVTNDLVTGMIQQNAAGSQFPFCVGVEIAAGAATGINTAQNVLYEWFDVRNEAQRVVRR